MKSIPVDQKNDVNGLNQESSLLETIRNGRGSSDCPLPDKEWSPLSVQYKRERFADADYIAQKDNDSVLSVKANADSTQRAKQPEFFKQPLAIIDLQKNTSNPPISDQEVLSNKEFRQQLREKILESKFIKPSFNAPQSYDHIHCKVDTRGSLFPKRIEKDFIKINKQRVRDQSAENTRQKSTSSSSETSITSCGPSRGR